MLNTECKQCHKKWHHDNAKYCSMCGNKLIDEPEFKVGDYVVEDGEEYIHGKAISLIERYVGSIYLGSYYVTGSNRFVDLGQDDGSEIDVDCARHATPEEIAEYEAALNFHKHGRKPFEVKKDDILLEDGDYKFFVNNPDIWSKEDFVSDGYTLFKTAEEVNEWLGADDDK